MRRGTATLELLVATGVWAGVIVATVLIWRFTGGAAQHVQALHLGVFHASAAAEPAALEALLELEGSEAEVSVDEGGCRPLSTVAVLAGGVGSVTFEVESSLLLREAEGIEPDTLTHSLCVPTGTAHDDEVDTTVAMALKGLQLLVSPASAIFF